MWTRPARALRAVLCLAVAAGLAVVASPAPRAAAVNGTCPTTTSWDVTREAPNVGWLPVTDMTLTYGSYRELLGEVSQHCTGGTNPTVGYVWAGRTYLQASYDSGRTWRNVYTGDTNQIWTKGAWRLKSARLRVSFVGATSYTNDRWLSSVSSEIKVRVRRSASMRLERDGAGVRARVAVHPSATIRGMRVGVQVRSHGVWRTVQRPVASRRGVVVAHFGRSRLGDTFRVVLPAGRGMIRSVVGPAVLRRP